MTEQVDRDLRPTDQPQPDGGVDGAVDGVRSHDLGVPDLLQVAVALVEDPDAAARASRESGLNRGSRIVTVISAAGGWPEMPGSQIAPTVDVHSG